MLMYNDYTTPMYLMKSARVAIELGLERKSH
jgi:hypothetical protein